MSNQIEMNDIIVLGNAVPDFISHNRTSVCTAGYSPTYGLVRIYPVPPSSPMKRWNIVKVPLERNPADTRRESWKIQDSRIGWNRINTRIRLVGVVRPSQRASLLQNIYARHGVGCTHVLNHRKLSLGLIKPHVLGFRMANRENYEPPNQTLFGYPPFLTIKNYRYQPRISYTCSHCQAKKGHNQQSVEWGVYEWMRKFPLRINEVWNNLGLTNTAEEKIFLVGNQKLHRTSFLVITVF